MRLRSIVLHDKARVKAGTHVRTSPQRRTSMPTPDTVSFGYEEVPAGAKTAMVGEVFSRVARKYDIMNDAMSGGMPRLWKDRFVRRVKPEPARRSSTWRGATADRKRQRRNARHHFATRRPV